MEEEFKRVFFGIKALAPWPDSLPKGRIIEEQHRHLTLAFLGKTNTAILLEALNEIPHPSFKIGLIGKFDQLLFLPPRHPRVVAAHISFFDEAASLIVYQKELCKWLEEKKFPPQGRADFLPHVTVARSPFAIHAWKKTFSPLPVVLKDIHLFESLGHSKYVSLWNYPLEPPFEEIEHTADMAFLVRGKSLKDLYNHALGALLFSFPPLLPFGSSSYQIANVADIVTTLNEMLSHADAEIGIPFKAVSYHGSIKEDKEGFLTWEMIIDV